MTGGVTTAADIWSVGCTLIELLTTKPPYFDLAPMAALFRMVRDLHTAASSFGYFQTVRRFFETVFPKRRVDATDCEGVVKAPVD